MRINFLLRKERINKVGVCPIDYRVRINNVYSTRYSTKVFLHPSRWDSKSQRIKGNSAQSQEENRVLETIRFQLKELYELHLAKKIYLSAKELCEVYLGKKTIGHNYSEVCKRRISVMKLKSRSPRTIENYERHQEYFLQHMGEDLEIDTIERRHVQDFWVFLRKKGYVNDYCNKIIMTLKGLFLYAERQGLIDRSPFRHVSLDWENKIDVTCLTPEEIEIIKNTEWSDKLQRVVDNFLFMCFTGLHISDYNKVADANLVVKNGREWIAIPRTKTKVEAIIPLHSEAKRILTKYGGFMKLPRISGQKSNDFLKLVGEQAGIAKNLTNKVARKTFTDMSLNEYHMSEESVAAMLGHTSTRYVRKYGQVRHERIISEWKDKKLA